MDEGGQSPIQIRAQVLCETPQIAGSAGIADFAMMPDAAGIAAVAGRKARWRQMDVKRAIGAAEQAGLRCYRVDIAPDGTISIVVGERTPPPGI
jgi:hypothetical protein